MKKITQAVILAGGYGSRLRPLTNTIPKAMIPFFGKPFLWYIINTLKKNNIRDIILLVGYKSEKIKNYFGDGIKFGITIRYSFDSPETDTGKRIKSALPLLDAHFLLVYGDVLWPLQMNKLIEAYYAPALMTVYRNRDDASKNNVFVANGIVKEYDKTRSNSHLNGVDIGYFILDKNIVKDFPETNFSFQEVISKLVKNKKLVGFVTDQKYYGLTNPERIPIIKKYLKPKKVIFLDRDGVINKKPAQGTYVANWNEFIFLPNVKKALKLLKIKGYTVYVITNQAGIARGVINTHEVNLIHNHLKRYVDGIYVCPHGRDEGCYCRKPNPGLLFQASYEHGVNLTQSICIGDDPRDIMAGSRAATTTILIGPDQTYPTLFDAVLSL